MLKSFKSLNVKKEIVTNQPKELEKYELHLFEKQKDAPTKKGTFGSVCKVKHSQSGKIYAKKSLTQDPSTSIKIEREIALWETLKALPEKPSSIPNFYCSFKGYLNSKL